MVMYLINAVYFKGTWTTQFKTDQTTDQPFTRQDGSTATCKLMHQKTDVEYGGNGNLQVVDLPYGSGTFRMTIVLPPPGADLDSLAATVTPVQWAAWTSSLHKVDLEMYLPRFKMSFEYQLAGPLSNLGMGIAFSDAADFTGINATVPLLITEVKHKTYVEVNEEGTEAAAVTSVGVGVTSMGPVMRVDHPFLFAIREQASGALLFIGKIADPTQ
jgi:serpin B